MIVWQVWREKRTLRLMQHPRTTIIFGGTSEEKLVSVASAQNVAQELTQADLWFVDPEGAVFDCGRNELLNHSEPFKRPFVPLRPSRFRSVTAALDAPDANLRVFFLALHGGEGENGTLQKALEDRELAFTGSGSLASHQAFDKTLAKKRVSARGIQVPEGIVLTSEKTANIETILSEMMQRYEEIILKPVAGGSSIGLFHLRNQNELSSAALKLKQSPGLPYLAEAYVRGREITVGVYEKRGALHALPPTEVCLSSNHDFDYEGKYLGVGSREITPAPISAELTLACQKVALSCHRIIGCEGYSRTDLILSEGGPVFLEINTLPGLTKASFIPQQLVAAGLSFHSFVEEQIAIALEKRDKSHNVVTSSLA